MNDPELFRRNVLANKPNGVKLVDIEKKAGYAKNHLIHIMYRNGKVSTECIRNYSKALGIAPQTLLEGMFDDGVERTD